MTLVRSAIRKITKNESKEQPKPYNRFVDYDLIDK
jgi:hypothetical protein